jgi:hypothetical protein
VPAATQSRFSLGPFNIQKANPRHRSRAWVRTPEKIKSTKRKIHTPAVIHIYLLVCKKDIKEINTIHGGGGCERRRTRKQGQASAERKK